MRVSKRSTKKLSPKKLWIDPDDGPEFTAAMAEHADFHIGETLIRRGRPPVSNKKVAVSARFDADVVQAFRKMGPGWQTQMNGILRQWLSRRHKLEASQRK